MIVVKYAKCNIDNSICQANNKNFEQNMLEQLFGSVTRVKILSLFFGQLEGRFYTQEITKKLGTDVANTHRELIKLEKLSILKSEKQGSQKYYFLNHENEYFDGLKVLFVNQVNNVKKADYFHDGTTQSALAYYHIPWIACMNIIGGKGAIIADNGIVSFWVDKRAATKQKDKLLSNSPKGVAIEFNNWLRWLKEDDRLFEIASKEDLEGWEKDWEIVEKISKNFWEESYILDSIDPFATQIEAQIAKALQKIGLDKSYVFDLITPVELTLPLRRNEDLLKVKVKQLSIDSYLRRYWFSKGTWNGGVPLTEQDIKKEIALIKNRKSKLHDSTEIDGYIKKLDKETQDLVNILRTLALWREERKGMMQRINIAMHQIITRASEDLNIDKKLILWSTKDEVSSIAENPEKFRERFKRSVFILGENDKKGKIVIGTEANKVSDEFTNKVAGTTLKGMVASKGVITGHARIIMRTHEFHRFQENEILVTTMTRPEFVPLMRRASAIITDEGGITCHAAIVSRELGKPCIIGTKNATQVLQDGDLLEVNAEKGIIKIL